MPDVIDAANEHIERELQALLERRRLRSEANAQVVSLDGRCLECRADIGVARLEALPHALRCIDCARIAEIHYREFAWRSR